jgi:membrane protease YdiL (CAAX protease family)
MNFSGESLTLYLLGSVLFCWIAVWMARPTPSPPPEIKNPARQKITAPAIFAGLVAVSIVIRYVFTSNTAEQKNIPGLIFSGIVVAAVIAAAAAVRDSFRSVGLPLRGAETAIFFLVPPLALIFMPGHAVNLKLLLKGIAPATVAGAFSEELFFRGYLQTRFQSLFGNLPGLFLAAAAFTLFRMPMIWGLFTVPALIANLLVSFLVWGCAAGIIYRRAGNIYGLILLRVFWDTAAVVFAGFAIR